MLFKTQDKASGKTLHTSRPLLITPQQAYVRPQQGDKDWWGSTTTIWNIDEIIKRRVRDWRRLTGETGHDGTRNQTFRADHDSLYTGTHSVFPAPLMEMIIMRYGGQIGSSILDAFAGGPPRGLVASIMGHKYTGVEIRQQQIDENKALLDSLKLKGAEYVLGDGRYLDIDRMFDCGITCHPADTVISTSEGTKFIDDIKVEDKVLTHDGKFRNVSETLKFDFSGTLFSFKRIFSDKEIRATPEHPFYVMRDGRLQWVRADNVVRTDLFTHPIEAAPSHVLDGLNFYFTNGSKALIDENLLSLCGYYVAEGHLSARQTHFAFNSKEIKYHKEVEESCKTVFDVTTYKKIVRSTTVSIQCSSVAAVNFFSEFGQGAVNKRIPNWVFTCSNKLLVPFIRSMWNGDGCIEKRKGGDRLSYTTVSPHLANGLNRALLRLGIVASVRIRLPRAKGIFTDGKYVAFKNTLPQHELTVRGHYVSKLANLLGYKISEPKTSRRPTRSPIIIDRHVCYPIKGISKRLVKHMGVFNLEVDDDHSFIADGVSSHNCPPYYNLEVYSEQTDDLSSLSSYAEFNASMYLCANAYRQRIKPNGFVCMVVGLFRDKKTGELIDFPADTVENFRDAGFIYWQHIILSKNFASAAVRAGNAWRGHKLVPRHENLLIFRAPGG